jgi:malonate decarboxylase alpha subunit
MRQAGWSTCQAKKAARLSRVTRWLKGPVQETGRIVEALQELLEPGDAVALEGDNQKQADFLSRDRSRPTRRGSTIRTS